jgi:hypothetical protein
MVRIPKKPKEAQEKILDTLLKEYSKTEYGTSFHAAEITGIPQYQSSFPIANYQQLIPYIAKVREGKYQTFLSEPPECWVMTRGSTGSSKVLPATKTHLKQIFSCGDRVYKTFTSANRKKQKLNPNPTKLETEPKK